MLLQKMGTASLSLVTHSNGTRGKKEKSSLIWMTDKRGDYSLAHWQYLKKRLGLRPAKSRSTRAVRTLMRSARALKIRSKMSPSTDLLLSLDVEFSVCDQVINRCSEGQQFR